MPQDRKALSREYRNTPRTMGIGVVRNIAFEVLDTLTPFAPVGYNPPPKS